MLNKDAMNMADPVKVGHAAMSVIDSIQDYQPEMRVMGMALAFLALCDRFQVRPNDTFLVVQNVMNGVAGERPEFAAVHSYLEDEL